MDGIIKAVCLSKEKGTMKQDVSSCLFIENHGLQGDGHAGPWHRQVSLLSSERVDAFNEAGGNAKVGDFGENLLVSGIAVDTLPVGSRLRIGDVVLEVTQIGKVCHSHCEIYKRVGDCIMPRCGIFARVLHGGIVKNGDRIEVISTQREKMLAAVVTLSDKGFKGEREDLSGPYLVEELERRGYEVVEHVLLPDHQALIEKELKRLCDQRQVNLILTTGGTGFSPRDVTPEATMKVMTRNVPGIAEMIRLESMKYTKRAMLSRAVSVIRNQTLIVNLPGSLKAVKESLEIFVDCLDHALGLLSGQDGECGR